MSVVVDVTQPNPAITLDDIGDDVDVDALIASTQRNTIPGDPARAAHGLGQAAVRRRRRVRE